MATRMMQITMALAALDCGVTSPYPTEEICVINEWDAPRESLGPQDM